MPPGFTSFNSRATFQRARRGAWPMKFKPQLQASLLVAFPSKAPTPILHFPLRGPPLPILSFRPHKIWVRPGWVVFFSSLCRGYGYTLLLVEQDGTQVA